MEDRVVADAKCIEVIWNVWVAVGMYWVLSVMYRWIKAIVSHPYVRLRIIRYGDAVTCIDLRGEFCRALPRLRVANS